MDMCLGYLPVFYIILFPDDLFLSYIGVEALPTRRRETTVWCRTARPQKHARPWCSSAVCWTTRRNRVKHAAVGLLQVELYYRNYNLISIRSDSYFSDDLIDYDDLINLCTFYISLFTQSFHKCFSRNRNNMYSKLSPINIECTEIPPHIHNVRRFSWLTEQSVIYSISIKQ